MKTTALICAALLAALGSATFAQGTAPPPATASKDPVVQMRDERAVANADYKKKKSALDAEHKKKISALVDAELKGSAAKAKEPQVARRDAEANAKKATKADYDGRLKALKAEHKAALDAIDKKYATAGKSAAKGG